MSANDLVALAFSVLGTAVLVVVTVLARKSEQRFERDAMIREMVSHHIQKGTMVTLTQQDRTRINNEIASINAARERLFSAIIEEFDLVGDPHAKTELHALASDIYSADPVLAGQLILATKHSTFKGAAIL